MHERINPMRKLRTNLEGAFCAFIEVYNLVLTVMKTQREAGTLGEALRSLSQIPCEPTFSIRAWRKPTAVEISKIHSEHQTIEGLILFRGFSQQLSLSATPVLR
jgi:hypothetical protein